jgi:predicted metal-dependent HD superfamily phosphohydrolase
MPLITDEIRAELERAYAAPGRHYHDLRHIAALLVLAKDHAAVLTDPAAVEAAIWFHDAVYDTCRDDNEAKSADLAVERLRGRCAAARIACIVAMIRATATHVVPSALDERAAQDCILVLDMDLSILGSAPDAYAAYVAAVRREYAWVPEDRWIDGRRKVLERFLARPRIYASPVFQHTHEAAARANMGAELAQLQALA